MQRPGVSLVELILFLAIAAIMGLIIMPLMFSSTENRLLQESIAQVENNGSQLMQVIGRQVRDAEKILDPPSGGAGKAIALQMSSGAITPTIIGLLTGAVIQIQKTTQQTISATEVSVQDFRVRNVSNGTSSGIIVSFKISRSLRLEAPRTYTQFFESSFTLYPKKKLVGNPCNCALPGCTGTNHYAWQVCNTVCQDAVDQLACN